MRLKFLIFGLLFFFFGSANNLQSQNKIHFADINIKAATQRANIENKNIFVDTYAPWCGPCKIMDIHFQDKEVINYFNRHFINVKINTDTPYGKKMSTKYQIAFLPTLLILNKDGGTRFKVDKLINRDELLSLARLAIEGPKNPRPVSPPPPKKEVVKTTPKKIEAPVKETPIVEDKAVVENVEEEEDVSGEKILYVLDANATNLPPEILYEEAYFRLQLNDGSHKEAAKKYLATQEDWDTEKNLKFIFDFLYDTDSEEFEYFINKKNKFQEVIEVEKLDRSLKILIENKLYQGIPRPSFERSEYLLALIDAENSSKNNYHYFLNRLHAEQKKEQFNTMCAEYLKVYEKLNQEIVVNYISGKLQSKSNKSKLRSYLNLLTMVEDPVENYDMLLLSAKIYYGLADKENAFLKVSNAIETGQQAKIDVSQAKLILENIEEL